MEARRKAIEERARLDSDIASIDRVLELLGVSGNEFQGSETETGETESLPAARESTSSPLQEVERPVSRNGRSKKLRITREIRNAVQEFEGEFSQRDVVRWIQDRYPSAEIRAATVSSTLWRMANQTGVIEKVREGYGSEPNTYQRVSRDGSAQESLPNEERTSNETDTPNKEDLMSG